MTISEILKECTTLLKNEKIESASLDCRLLLCYFLGVDTVYLITHKNEEVENYEEFYRLFKRRLNREPMQYILGRAEFMGLDFTVNENVLIPRADTETLVEKVIEFVGNNAYNILDIGTGSGCIPISVLKNCPGCNAVAVDISEAALNVARQNAKNHGVDEKIQFTRADILKEFPGEKFDCIISNPPYIREDVIPTLMEDVKGYEPHIALSGGADGLIFYRRIAREATTHLAPGGLLAFEIGYDQADDLIEILAQNGYKNIAVTKDLAGNDRVVSATL